MQGKGFKPILRDLSMIICFEGGDGVGKSIQIELLKKELNAELFKYPTKNTPELYAYLEKKIEMDEKQLFHLFLKDIMNEQSKIKKAKLEKEIILDRYIFSTLAYEKKGISYEQGKKIIKKMNFIIPDKVILLDIPVEISQKRKLTQKNLDRYESNKIYLEKVRTNFLKLYKEKFLTKNWYLIDGNQSIEEIHQEIMKIIKG